MLARTGLVPMADEDMREKARRWQARAADADDPRQREMFERLAADYEAAAISARRHGRR
ncbi:hypothetical protein [Brevundimonas sp.]|uniref:hypothetical protein n=1 Tax=Brevundimonas sp. TaxID=1871086 RepID=UPI002ED8A27B